MAQSEHKEASALQGISDDGNRARAQRSGARNRNRYTSLDSVWLAPTSPIAHGFVATDFEYDYEHEHEYDCGRRTGKCQVSGERLSGCPSPMGMKLGRKTARQELQEG